MQAAGSGKSVSADGFASTGGVAVISDSVVDFGDAQFDQLSAIARVDLDGSPDALIRSGVLKLADAQMSALQAGAFFLKAKAGCRHGQFGVLLSDMGVDDRQVQRAMQIASYVGQLPPAQAQRIAGLPKMKILPLISADQEVVAELLDSGQLDGEQPLSVRALQEALRKESAARQTAELKREKAEASEKRVRELALNRFNRSDRPEFEIVAKEEAVALVDAAMLALSGCEALLRDVLLAPHDSVLNADHHKAVAAGTLYHSVKAVWARSQFLLEQLREHFGFELTDTAKFEHQLSGGSVDQSRRAFEAISGRLKVQAENREAERANAKGGRGRPRKLKSEA